MNFGCFATLVKAHCINRRINNMELVNGLLEGIIQYANLTNKNGEELRFDKYESSKLLNNKNNIPLKIVDALRREGIADSIRPSFESFVADNIDNGLIEDLVASLQNQIENVVSKHKCPASIQNYGMHLPAYQWIGRSKFWNYEEIRKAIMGA